MKIELPNGMTIHLEGGEEIAAVVPWLMPGDPAPAPRATTEEEAIDPGQEISLFTIREMEEAAPAARRRRPTSVHLTDEEAQALRHLRENPEGITTAALAQTLGKAVNVTAAIVWRLRTKRPSTDTTTPLVNKVSNGRHRVTALGRSVKIMVTERPALENRKLGWEES
jgi:hypothetical protein